MNTSTSTSTSTSNLTALPLFTEDTVATIPNTEEAIVAALTRPGSMNIVVVPTRDPYDEEHGWMDEDEEAWRF